MTSPVIIVVMMATVCTTLRLEGRPHFYKIRSQAAEHLLDDNKVESWTAQMD
jgi:hypothetical protein